jgi:hypothetical protein
MTDLISRQAALESVNDCGICIQRIVDIPTAEAVEVVRCRDCKHNPNDTWFECPIAHLPYNEDRWCWKGERKDG